ncbi:MAG: hypothetical protein GC162_12690 [Planctomycetes bacterium]|nr:hypothetical protein [Planctomycetota bacterium]
MTDRMALAILADGRQLAIYQRMVQVHAALTWSHRWTAEKSKYVMNVQTLHHRAAGRHVAVATVIAATLLLAAGLWWSTGSGRPIGGVPVAGTTPGVATLTDFSKDAAFAGGERQLGDALPSGELFLRSGQAQIMFESTAVVDFSGPCRFEMTGPNRGRLASGSMQAYVPQRAHGFTLELPGGYQVVDLGTRFNVLTGASGNVKLNIDEGAVEFRQPASDTPGQPPMTLHAGQSLQLIDGMVNVSQPENLLIDGDFERLALGEAEGWVSDGNRATLWYDEPLWGSRCVRLLPKESQSQGFVNVYQWVTGIKPGERLRFTGHVRTDANNPLHARQQVILRLNYYEGPQHHLHSTMSQALTPTSPNGAYQTLSVAAIAPPIADRVQAVVVMIVDPRDPTPAPAYVDDLRLYRDEISKEPPQ